MTTTYDLASPGDTMTSAMFNALARGVIVRCSSDDYPTDAVDGTFIFDTDTGRTKCFRDTIWVDTAWVLSGLDFGASAIIGTKPGNILELPPFVYDRSFIPMVTNDAGGWNFVYPEAFPNCILQMICVVGDSQYDAVDVQPILENCDLTQLNGRVRDLAGDPIVNGGDFRLNVRIVGC